MALRKREYKDQETIITAENLNDIQDAVIALEDGLFSIDNDKSGEVIAITDAAKRGLRSLNIYGKTTQNGTPTPEAPVDLVSVEAPMVGVWGKNLLTSFTDSSKTENGITFTVNGNGSITINGTSTESAQFNMFALYELPPSVHPGIAYTISGATNVAAIHVYEWQDNWVRLTDTTNETTFMLSAGATGILIRYVIQPNTAVKNLTVYPMLRVASVANNTYEQGKAAQAAIFDHTLHGVPVATGGNYTDANGQQWVCDEIDFVRGKLVVRILSEAITGMPQFRETPDWPGRFVADNCLSVFCKSGRDNALSNFARFGTWGYGDAEEVFAINSRSLYYHPKTTMTADEVTAMFAGMIASETPPVVAGQLESPVEIDLSEEELAAFAALHTYKDHTTVSNDAGAWMDLEYVMDAKKYIDSLALGTILPATVE